MQLLSYLKTKVRENCLQSNSQQAEEYCEKMRDNEESRISHYDIGLFRNIQCFKLRPHCHPKREWGGRRVITLLF